MTSVVLVGGVYAALVAIMWGAYSVYSGLPYETAFPYMSESASVLGGFLYAADPLRIHTNTFYHLSYLLAEAFGVGGTYVTYQVVHALLWWARGFLVFLLLRRFLPGAFTVCYVAGALVLVHASDGVLQWIGQMNQFGYIFWMLAAWYGLTLAFQAPRPRIAAAFTVVACLFEYMSLWSYESQIVLLTVFPLALPLFLGGGWPRFVRVAGPWYAVIVVYVSLTVSKYVNAAGTTYQQTVIRQRWDLTLLGDWLFNVVASLAFWDWTRRQWKFPEADAIALAWWATCVFVVGGVGVALLWRARPGSTAPLTDMRSWCLLLASGFVLLVLSFPVYLLLDAARTLWRTQLLSGIGSAVVMTAAAAVVATAVGAVSSASIRPRLGLAVLLGLSAVIVHSGSVAAIQKGGFHRWGWDRHRAVIAQILTVAPSVRDESVIVLTGLPKPADPFGHNMWLDLSLRLAYPYVPVAGIYFYDNGTPSEGQNLKVEGDRWKWNGTGFAPIVRDTSVANTVVLRYDGSGALRVAESLPAVVCPPGCAADLYAPTTVIDGPLSRRAARRYGMTLPAGVADREGPRRPPAPAASREIAISRDPARSAGVNPRINTAINPEINTAINPRIHSAINPRINSAINPVLNNAINPKVNTKLDPRVNTSLDPTANATIDRRAGLYLWSLEGQLQGVVVPDTQGGFLLFSGTEWRAYAASNGHGGYNLFAPDATWIGYLLSNSRGGFNRFDIEGRWTGFTT